MLLGYRPKKTVRRNVLVHIVLTSVFLLTTAVADASVVHFLDSVKIDEKDAYTPTMTVVTADGARFYTTAVEATGTKGVILMAERKKDSVANMLGVQPTTPKVVVTNGGSIVGMDQPQALVLSADGKNIYVASRNSDGRHGVISFEVKADGTLGYMQAMLNGESFDGGKKIEGLDKLKRIALSNDGKHLYTTSDDVDGAIAVFSRNVDAANKSVFGKLTFTEIVKNGVNNVVDLRGAYDVAFVNGLTQPLVYVTAPRSGELQIFERNTANGALTQLKNNLLSSSTDTVTKPKGYSALLSTTNPIGLGGAEGGFVFPPFLYAARAIDSSIVSYTVDTLTGELKTSTVFENGKTAIDGLGGIMELALSSDATKLLAASVQSSSLVLFRRNPVSGELRYIETLRDGEYGVDGLIRSGAISVVHDAPYIYTTAMGDSTLPGEKKIGIFALAESDLDLKVRRVSEDELVAGQTIEFYVEVYNASTTDATHAAVAFTATSPLEYVDATIKNGVCAEAEAAFNCEIGSVGSKQSVNFLVKVKPTSEGAPKVDFVVFADQLDSHMNDNVVRLSINVGKALPNAEPTTATSESTGNKKAWYSSVEMVQLIAIFMLSLFRVIRRQT